MNSKKNILVMGTGGTIAGKGEEGVTGHYKSAQVKINNLIEEIPYIKSIANVQCEDVFTIDSCDLTIENLKHLTNHISEAAEREDVDGIVVTHGTDTLEETAYFLNLTLKTKKPVVLTGSIRPGTAISADGPLNLYQSIALAANKEAKNKGVLVCFNDAIYSARDVSKVNTFRTQAFGAKDLGCIGYMQYDKPFFYTSTVKKHTHETEFDVKNKKEFPKVEIVYFYTGADPKILECAAKNSDGIVIAGAGCGGVNSEMNKIIENLIKKGFPVVRSSRVGNGLVTFDEEEIETQGVCANNLNPQKSRILLILALTITKDLHEIQKIFNIY